MLPLLLSQLDLDEYQRIGMILKHVKDDRKAVVVDYTSTQIIAACGKGAIVDGEQHMAEDTTDYEFIIVEPREWIVLDIGAKDFDVLIE
jgi:hypothetical protein